MVCWELCGGHGPAVVHIGHWGLRYVLKHRFRKDKREKKKKKRQKNVFNFMLGKWSDSYCRDQ